MLTQRLLVLFILIPSVVGFVYLGGWFLVGFTLAAMLMGAWEYWRMFRCNGFSPSLPVLLIGVLLTIIGRALFQFQAFDGTILLILLASAVVHIIQYERGDEKAAINFALTIAGTIYLGGTSAYIISLRALPDGMWWLILIIAATALADSGAYLFGRRWGNHKLSRRVSPKKSWEGYIGGIFFSLLCSSLIAYLWSYKAPSITVSRGLAISLVMSLLPTFGDLTISLIKRQCGFKDSSQILPGHGGILDRVDSFLWALPIGYYLVIWFLR